MEELEKGLIVMVLGMGVVFLALIIIMFVMMGLERAFRTKDEPESSEVAQSTETSVAGEEATAAVEVAAAANVSGNADNEVVAAIALAIARARQEGTYRTRGTSYHVPLSNGEGSRWDWVWDEGVDDYGTTRN
ncbi:MAG: OadG family protein [Chloroflexota bacterium]